MIKLNSRKKIKRYILKYDKHIVLIFLLIVFFCYAIFIALHIDRGIIPDEISHFAFSKQFSTTIGIPTELPEAYRYGVYITQSPFLFNWINGRLINIVNIILPSTSVWWLLVILRIINVLYSLGTIFFCYLFSKEFIKLKWWQLLPVFFLTNTLMFVFLSGGLNYDNLTNLLCFAGLYFLAKVLAHNAFLPNSLGWMICIALGCLTKFTVLPLALAMGIVWVTYLIKNRKQVLPYKFQGKRIILLSFLLLLLIIGNLAIYGHNLVVYQSIIPECEDILTEEECKLDFYNMRMEKYGLEEKLTMSESIIRGYPNPIEYFFHWIAIYTSAIFGIGSHRNYKTSFRILSHWSLFLWVFIISIINKIKINFKNSSFILIFLFYLFILFIKNYNGDLASGFKHFGENGRYFFPVIGILFIALTKGIMKIPNIIVRKLTLIFALLLYFFTGPLTFIYRYNTAFSDWFVR